MQVNVAEESYTVSMALTYDEAVALAQGLQIAQDDPNVDNTVRAVCGQLRGALNTATNER